MPAVLLTILKIIGIVLLCIIGFILLVLLALLIIPFRYRVNARKIETESDKIIDAIKAEIHVTWLLHFVHVGVIFDKVLDLWIKVLGIKFVKRRLWDGPKPKDHKKEYDDDSYWPDDFDEDFGEEVPAVNEKSVNSEAFTESISEDSSLEEVSYDKGLDTKNSVNEITSDKKIEVDDTSAKKAYKEETSINETSDKKTSEKESSNHETSKNDEKDIFDKIGEGIERLGEKVVNGLDKLSELAEKPEEFIDKAVDTYDYYTHLLGTKGAEKSIDFLKEEVLKILKSLRPRKGKVYIDFASTDPEKTAKIYELYGCLLGILPKKSKVYIDFDEDRLYFDITINGNIYLGYVVIHGLKILFNKRLKKFIKLLKREEK